VALTLLDYRYTKVVQYSSHHGTQGTRRVERGYCPLGKRGMPATLNRHEPDVQGGGDLTCNNSTTTVERKLLRRERHS